MPTDSLPWANFNFLRSVLCIFLLACWIFLAAWAFRWSWPAGAALGGRAGRSRAQALWAEPRLPLCPAGSGRHLGSAAQACGCGAGAELLLSPWGLPGWNPCLLHQQAASSPLGPRGGPLHWAIQHCVITAVSSPEHHPECGLEAVLPPPSNWKVAGCLALSENYRSPGV